MAAGLQPSAILQLAGEIRQKIEAGTPVYNLTIGDFDPAIFPIPQLLKEEIGRAYQENETNYPVANGMPELRQAIAGFTRRHTGLDYDAEAFLVASGARPLIFSAYMSLLDPDDAVIYPAPSWNNNYYCHIMGARQVVIPTLPEDNFMLPAAQLRPHLAGASLLALCSPLNPTGTVFSEAQLRAICELVLEENARRPAGEKPLYVLYDQIYGNLTHGDTRHVTPVGIFPEMRPYTIFIDGISKAFAATGLRLGWGFGPAPLIGKMKAITSHIGAWSARAEQVATGRFLSRQEEVAQSLRHQREQVYMRLQAFYEGFQRLKQKGFPIDAIAPQAAIYLSVKIDLQHCLLPGGQAVHSPADTQQYLLDAAGLALVPFEAFGTPPMPWFRLSVGTARMDDIPHIFEKLEHALGQVEYAVQPRLNRNT